MKWELRLFAEGKTQIGYVYGTTTTSKPAQYPQENKKIASFDLDQTLIDTNSGNKFPIDSNDWKWNYPNVMQKLHKLHKNEYEIIIVTNQAGIGSSEDKLNEF